MNAVFYLAAVVAIVSTVMVITRVVAVHALLYLIVSLLAVALVFYALGAPFAAALEVIIYAGAIMVLFLFVIMLLDLGPQAISQQRAWFTPRAWIGPSLLIAVLLIELIYALARGLTATEPGKAIVPSQVGMALFGPYLLGVELASMLLLAGLVGAHRLSAGAEASEERGDGV
jgi:NADH-quinone oxidoreductase subunit J